MYLPMLLEKRGIPRDDVLASLSELRAIVEAVEADFYRSFEQQARQRLRGRDEADWPILATALGLGCGLWTEDQDFFGAGVAVWTTSRIEILLEQESSASGSERSELS
jgi:predicted nucleic acid-binding protein